VVAFVVDNLRIVHALEHQSVAFGKVRDVVEGSTCTIVFVVSMTTMLCVLENIILVNIVLLGHVSGGPLYLFFIIVL